MMMIVRLGNHCLELPAQLLLIPLALLSCWIVNPCWLGCACTSTESDSVSEASSAVEKCCFLSMIFFHFALLKQSSTFVRFLASSSCMSLVKIVYIMRKYIITIIIHLALF